ncbi:MAG TPA: endonuclease MutS2 [Nitrospinaceae bacterium]|nr:endonuclease MutS2 [Nitrospinaceae bacterium]HIK57504.1 endonuclease MutS2 [Nitrospinaceae bacterium]
MSNVPLIEKSMDLLGWGRVVLALENHACSPITQDQCRELKPESDFDRAQTLLEETKEMVALLESLDSFPMDRFEDIGPILQDAEEQKIIEARQCLDLIKLLRLCRNLFREREKKTPYPHLLVWLERLNPLKEFLDDLVRCVDDEGNIRDNATPELRQAIRSSEAAKSKLEERLQRLFKSDKIREALQDSYITERNERMVIPVRAEFKSRVDGIVHDSSGTGQTLFIEPTPIVPLNNQLKIARLQVVEEKIKILQSLAMQTLQFRESLKINLEVLISLDLIFAKARLAKTMAAVHCPMNRNSIMELNEARNPELVLERETVVANTIKWDASIRVVIISGPNTGGKTVTLKTLGLLALMSRTGLYLPVKESSQIPFFPKVYSDIGDDQNIQLKLSTFSGHLKKIIHILDHVDAGSLVLLDELGIATDPNEGAALAEAILLDLKNKNVMTLVSTHYFTLKILAQTHAGFLNACTEFDLDTLSPTYRLIFGAPGQSAALDTAERLGLQKSIIDQARNLYQAKENRAENLLEDLTRQKLEFNRDAENIKQQKKETEALAREQRILTQQLRNEEKDFKKNKNKKLQLEVRAGKDEIQKIIRNIKGEKDLPKIRKAEKQIQSMGQISLSQKLENIEEWTVPVVNLKIGDPVLIFNLGAIGNLLEAPEKKKKLRVQMGNITTVVEVKGLRGHPRQKAKTAKKELSLNVHTESEGNSVSSCDLRGMNSEEAEATMEAFISRAIVQKAQRVLIIHGHGMGIIKTLVRNYLEKTALCKQFTPGSKNEGGDGVTVIEF